jgi:hypothetical protein
LVLNAAVFGTFTVVPNNMGGLLASTVTLTCGVSTPNGVQWLLNDLQNPSIQQVISTGTTVVARFPRFSVSTHSIGRYDLVITNTQMVDPGTYTCYEIDTEQTAAVYYTVLGDLL